MEGEGGRGSGGRRGVRRPQGLSSPPPLPQLLRRPASPRTPDVTPVLTACRLELRFSGRKEKQFIGTQGR